MRSWIIAGVTLLAVVVSNLALAKQFDGAASLKLEAIDTVAGYSTTLKALGGQMEEKAWFVVQNPLGEQFKEQIVPDGHGDLIFNFDSEKTYVSGEYLFAVVVDNQMSEVGRFNVYADRVSEDTSTVEPKNLYLNLGESEDLHVKLIDEHGNPIAGHLVKVVADGNDVSAEADNEISDENGEVDFSVSMMESGVASLSIYDVTADTLIASKSKVAAEGNLAMGNASGEVDHFEFEDLPAAIKKGENVSIKMVVQDSEDQPVIDYQGKVRFSVEGSNSNSAVLPDDYKFQIADQGEHVFSLAFLFQKTGTYHLKVTDLANSKVIGEANLAVTDSGADENPNSGITIANPIAGTYSNNVQVVSGTAPAGSKLKIFDNEVDLASITANAGGSFSFTTSALEDGEHKIYVASVNDVGTIVETSNVVTLNIDTFAPEISQVVIEPGDTVVPGGPIKVKVYTDSELSQAALVFENNIYELKKTDQGYFEGNLVAPNDLGEYKMDFVLTDELGNESKFEDQATLTVSNLLGEGSMANVEGLVANGEAGRVILRWNAAASNTSLVKNYRIYFGLSPNQLTQAVDTLTNATTWYIPNLQNGTKYYFAVIGVSEDGGTSEKFSNIVEAVPGGVAAPVVPVAVANGTAGSEAFNEMNKDVSETGPGIWWLVISSCVASVVYCKMRPWIRRKS